MEDADKKQIETVKAKAAETLVTRYDFMFDEAYEAVDESVRLNGSLWHVNSDAEELAKLLASEDMNAVE